MVDNIQGINPAGQNGPTRRLRHVELEKPSRGADSVEMTSGASELARMDGIRLDKVMEVRRALEAGTYLDPKKLDIALDRAIDEAITRESDR